MLTKASLFADVCTLLEERVKGQHSAHVGDFQHLVYVCDDMHMGESDVEVEGLWEGEEEDMSDEDKDWLIQRLREKDILLHW